MALFGSHHPAGRAARRWTRRSSTCPGPGAGSGSAAAIAELHPGAGRRRAGDHLLGRRRHHQVRGQARLDPGQAGRAARRAGRPGDGLPAPAAGRRAVGRGGEDRGAADPARPAHRRRPGQHPAGHAAAGARRGQRHPPARAGLGSGPAPGQPARAGEERRQRADLRAPTSTIPRSSTRTCSAWPTTSPRGCGPPGTSGAPSRSRSGSPTSAPSAGPAPCRGRPTWAWRSTTPSRGCTRRSACSACASAWSGVRVEGLADARDAPHQFAAGGARARSPRGRGRGRRPAGQVRIRCRARRPPGRPRAAQPRHDRDAPGDGRNHGCRRRAPGHAGDQTGVRVSFRGIHAYSWGVPAPHRAASSRTTLSQTGEPRRKGVRDAAL